MVVKLIILFTKKILHKMIVTTYREDIKTWLSQFLATGLFVFCWMLLFKMMF